MPSIEKVYFFPHTHTDIGYTHPQTEVVERQVANIGRALEYCRETEDRPPEARFAWTIETGWTLARFWEQASETERSLLGRYARLGRLQITASYLHLTQLVPPELLIRSLEPVLAIAQACGVEVDTAMSSDITGVNWFEAHLFPRVGVRYLNTAVNTARGGAPVPDERPGGFWWESPAGERLFVWNNVHYMAGNELLHFPEAPSFDALVVYLRELEARGYPYDTVLLPLQGYRFDNAMPNLAVCDLVEAFNRFAGGPLCRLATVGDALRDVAARWGDRVPVRRGAWPDWWDDGVASSAFETGLVRYAHGELLAAEKAASLATAFGAPWPFRQRELADLRENLLLYDEHTWGWWRSVEDPYSLETRALGHRKVGYAEEAVLAGRRYRERAIRTLAGRVVSASDDDQLIVFNPLAWPRRETVSWNVRWRNPTDSIPMAVRVLDADGSQIPCQNRLESYTGHLIPYRDPWVTFEADVPSLGYAIYRLQQTDLPIESPLAEEGRHIENEFYRVEVDASGKLCSLRDRELDRELAATGEWSVHQLIYEQVTSPGGRADLLAETLPPFDFAPNRAKVTFTTPQALTTHVVRDALGATLRTTSRMPHFPEIVQEVRLPNGHKRVDFVTRFIKDEVDAPEAVYVAFPFAIKAETVWCDVSGGAFEPGVGQLPGTVTEWYNVAHGVQLREEGFVITWLCGEAPLVEFGEMKTGKTPSMALLQNGLLFSYVLNNYWFTNFFARQSGEFTLRYRLLSGSDGDIADLERAGRELLQPLSAVRIGPPRAHDIGVEARKSSASCSPSAGFAEVIEGTASLDVVKPAGDGDGWIVRLYEIGGANGDVRVRFHWPCAVEILESDILERSRSRLPVVDGIITVHLRSYATATLRLRPVGSP